MGKGALSNQADAAVFSQLQAENETLKKENAALRQKLERMNELLLNAQRARFGQSSEKRTYVLAGGEQLRLFNEVEAVQNPKEAEPTEETLVKAHTRKPKRTIDELTEGLPVEKVVLELSEKEQYCDTCGTPLKKIGEKFAYREIEVTRRQVKVLEIYTSTYACPACEEKTGYAHIYEHKSPPSLMKHSLASASSVAEVIPQGTFSCCLRSNSPCGAEVRGWAASGQAREDLGAGWAGINPCHHGQLGNPNHSDMAETCVPLTEEATAE